MERCQGRIVRAFVDDDGSDGEGGELLHSANVRYVCNVGRREYASARLSEGSTRKLVFGEAIRMLHGIVQGREVDASRSTQAGSFRPDPGHRLWRHHPLRDVLSSGGCGGRLVLVNPVVGAQQGPDGRTCISARSRSDPTTGAGRRIGA